MTDVSIIIVNWNTKDYLVECLQSIKDTSSSVRAETIVVDNGSCDGSVDMVRRKFLDVTVIENKANLGFSRANNIGIRRANGEYICLVNSDVVVLPHCIDKLLEYMIRDARVGITGPRMLDASRIVRRSVMSFPSLTNSFYRAVALDAVFPKSRRFADYLMGYEDFSHTREVDVLNGYFWMVRQKAIEEVGLLDEGFFFYGEDVDYCRRFSDSGWLRVFVADAEAIHYGGVSSSVAPLRFNIELQRANVKYWKKYAGAASAFTYSLILIIHHAIRAVAYSIGVLLTSISEKRLRLKMRRSRAVAFWLLVCRPFGLDFMHKKGWISRAICANHRGAERK